MASLIPRLILTGLGASISPVAIMAIISVMLMKKPLRNSLLFLVGFTFVLVSVGVIVVFVLHARGGSKTGNVDGYIDIAFGALCLLGIFLTIRRKPKPAPADEPREMKASRAFTLGMVMMLVNFSTWVIYLAGMHFIAEAKLSVADDVIAMVILTVMTLITLLIPIFFEAAFPKTAEKGLTSMRLWLARHNKLIGAIILAVFAIYLLEKGIRAIV
jgi:threonine/homoserine/homoserine lactone efflux protein